MAATAHLARNWLDTVSNCPLNLYQKMKAALGFHEKSFFAQWMVVNTRLITRQAIKKYLWLFSHKGEIYITHPPPQAQDHCGGGVEGLEGPEVRKGWSETVFWTPQDTAHELPAALAPTEDLLRASLPTFLHRAGRAQEPRP